MTPTTVCAVPAAGSAAGAGVEHDLQSLADQLRRCTGRRAVRWRGFAARLRVFASSHVIWIASASGLLGAACVMLT